MKRFFIISILLLLFAGQVLWGQIPRTMSYQGVLTDGAGNVSMTDMPAQEEAHHVASLIRADHIRTVVINMEHATFDRGLAQALADEMDAPCYTLHQLRAETLYQTVRSEISQGLRSG